MISLDRQREFEAVRRAVTSWAERDDSIVAVLLVGSWARAAARMDSDIDVVIIGDTRVFATEQDWIGELFRSGAQLIRTADWGAVTERRVRLEPMGKADPKYEFATGPEFGAGCEVEFG